MDCDQFNKLAYYDQMEAVLEGIYLADRMTEHHYVRLYSLGRIYIEVFFDNDTDLISLFRAFNRTLFLLPYLEDVHLML